MTFRADILRQHLVGKVSIGVYPLLKDETCHFLAIDFDKASWMEDVAALTDTCNRRDVTHAVERSRSGNEAHVWFFFVIIYDYVDSRIPMARGMFDRRKKGYVSIGYYLEDLLVTAYMEPFHDRHNGATL